MRTWMAFCGNWTAHRFGTTRRQGPRSLAWVGRRLLGRQCYATARCAVCAGCASRQGFQAHWEGRGGVRGAGSPRAVFRKSCQGGRRTAHVHVHTGDVGCVGASWYILRSMAATRCGRRASASHALSPQGLPGREGCWPGRGPLGRQWWEAREGGVCICGEKETLSSRTAVGGPFQLRISTSRAWTGPSCAWPSPCRPCVKRCALSICGAMLHGAGGWNVKVTHRSLPFLRGS